MLVFAREVHHLGHFGLSYFVGVHTTLTYAVMVDMQHDPRGGLVVFSKKFFQDQKRRLFALITISL